MGKNPIRINERARKFQRFMERCLGDLRDKVAIPYLDDIIDFSRTFEEHVEHLRTVLRKLLEHGLKLKPRKCSLFKRKAKFLERVVSDDGYRMDPGCVQAIEKLREVIPQNVGEVRQLAGILRANFLGDRVKSEKCGTYLENHLPSFFAQRYPMVSQYTW